MTPNAESFQTRRVLTISMGHMIHDMYPSFLPVLLPILVSSLALSNTKAGVLALCAEAPWVLQPAIGHFADRHNMRSLLIVTPIVTATVMSLLGAGAGYSTLVVLLIVAGFSGATFHAVGSALAGRWSGRRLGRGISLWMVGGELGYAMGPIVVVGTVKLLTLQGVPWLIMFGLLGSVALWLGLRDTVTVPVHSSQALPWQDALRGMRRAMLPLIGLIVVRSLMISALNTYLPMLLLQQGSDFWLAGISTSMWQTAGAVGVVLGGSLSDRLGRRPVLLTSGLLTPLFLIGFLFARGWLQLLILLGLGLSAMLFEPVAMAVVQENSAENRALAASIYMSLGVVSRGVSAPILGAFADLFGLWWAFAASALIVLLGPLFLSLLARGKSRRAA